MPDESKQQAHEESFANQLSYPQPFDQHAISLCQSASRYLCILSPRLDHAAFDNQAMADAVSALARAGRHTQVRILVSDTRNIITYGHRLLQLARRLPSKVHIRTMKEHPDWNGETIVMRDHDGVLYKPAGPGHDAFYEPDSRASTRRHLDLFDSLWTHSVADPELRALSL